MKFTTVEGFNNIKSLNNSKEINEEKMGLLQVLVTISEHSTFL